MPQLDMKELSLKILAQAPDAIMFADREGIVRLWNQGAERIFCASAWLNLKLRRRVERRQ
jgi:PAS domain-containing protein